MIFCCEFPKLKIVEKPRSNCVLNEGKSIWGLTIVDKPHSNCVSNEGKIIWELTIIDKPHSNCVLNEGNKHLTTYNCW